MVDPQLEDFYVRVARIEAARRKGFGFEAAGTVGRSSYSRHTRRWIPIFRPLLVVALCVVGLKAVIHYNIGDETYRARVVELQAGEGFDRLGPADALGVRRNRKANARQDLNAPDAQGSETPYPNKEAATCKRARLFRSVGGVAPAVRTHPGSARDVADPVDVAAAQTDIVQLAVGKPCQRVARDAGIVPGCNGGRKAPEQRSDALGRDGAERRPAGRLIGGHGGSPFKNGQRSSTLPP